MDCPEDFRKEEYELQLFGHTVNDLSFHLRDSLEESFNHIVENLMRKLGERENADMEKISAAHESLKKYGRESIYGFSDELKKVIEKYFNIPSHVLLPEDKVHILSYSAEQNNELDKELQELTKQLESVRMMKQCLEQEDLSLNKSQALAKELLESGLLDSLDINSDFFGSTALSHVKEIMKIVNSIDVNEEEHN